MSQLSCTGDCHEQQQPTHYCDIWQLPSLSQLWPVKLEEPLLLLLQASLSIIADVAREQDFLVEHALCRAYAVMCWFGMGSTDFCPRCQ
jgi:hypothetical protein